MGGLAQAPVLCLWHGVGKEGCAGVTRPCAPASLSPCLSSRLSLKETPELDEDEGFSDWSQKPAQRQQAPPWGVSPEGDPEEDRQVGFELEPAPGTGSLRAPKPCLSDGLLLPFPAPRRGPSPERGLREEERGCGERAEETSSLGRGQPSCGRGVATSAHICGRLT